MVMTTHPSPSSQTSSGPHVKDVLYEPYKWLHEGYYARFNVMYGGASSGKSWTTAAYLMSLALSQPGVGILVLRKTLPSCRRSCIRLVEYWLSKTRIRYTFNKTDLIIRLPGDSFFEFGSLDDVEKLKSIESINYVWLEEATELVERDFLQLHIRCRAHNPHGINRLFLTFNPVDPQGNKWLKRMTDLRPESHFLGARLRVFHINHGDNYLLAPEQHAAIEALADSDAEYDKIYRLGEWATPTQIIYTNWDTVDRVGPYSREGYGLDFGYVHPTALVRVCTHGRDAYLDEIIYETRLHNADLIERMKGTPIPATAKIVADSAEPAYIEEIRKAGFKRCSPVAKIKGHKEKNFVVTGIDRCKRWRLHITKRSTNIIEEIEGYKWRVDKDGLVMAEPVKFEDHAMDAVRYFLGGQPLPKARIIQVGQYEY